MKNYLLIVLLIFVHYVSFAQGLENVIVERYYITDRNDARGEDANAIEVNSITYRVFVDMKPGYNLQSVFGSPDHALSLSTSTYFYNQTTNGNYIPNLITESNLTNNTVMLDSWISIGAGSQLHYAVLKADDDTIPSVIWSSKSGYLISRNPLAGIPLTEKDGLVKLIDLPPRVTQVGIDSLLNDLNSVSMKRDGYKFITENGGWGCIGGARGVDSLTNRVCIGQFTTNGDFHFEFNIQIGSPEHGVEQYVARNASGKEILNEGLIISFPKMSESKLK